MDKKGIILQNIKLIDNRFYIDCDFVLGTRFDKPHIETINFIVDTGARYTCCYYRDLDRRLDEKLFEKQEHIDLGGFVEGLSVRFYRYHVALIKLGDNVNLKDKDIWITFDSRITDYTLGMDILKDVSFLFTQKSNSLILFQDYNEMTAYISFDKEQYSSESIK